MKSGTVRAFRAVGNRFPRPERLGMISALNRQQELRAHVPWCA